METFIFCIIVLFIMDNVYDIFPDDLRLRYVFCERVHRVSPEFPPLFTRPHTVIAGLVEGRASLKFADRNKAPVSLFPGDVNIFPANCRRQIRTITPGGVNFIVAGFLFEIKGGIELLNLIKLPGRLEKTTQSALLDLLKTLFALETNASDHAEILKNVSRQKIGYAMLEHILAVSTPREGIYSARLILPAVEFLNDNFREPPDLIKLIKHSGLSKTHFFRTFKGFTGTTPLEYVKRLRLREAMLLLHGSDLTIAEIGDKVGWSDPYYFSKIFKATTGMPPSEYRIRQTIL